MLEVYENKMLSLTEVILVILMSQGFISLILPKIKELLKPKYEINKEFGYVSAK
jgi:hypothetical protein